MTSARLRLLFAGTPEVAVPSLEALAQSRHELVGVITREDAPQGRKRVLTPSPVAVSADRAGVSVLKANRVREAETEWVCARRPDLGVIVAYGGLLRAPMLTAPRLGWINLHFSLLPRWRGAAPVQRAIIAGDTEIGTAVFQLVEELDAGDVYSVTSRPLGLDETAGAVLETLAAEGAKQLLAVVDDLAAGTAHATPQQGEASYAAKLSLEDARLDWAKSCVEIYSQLRGVSPEPGAFTIVARLADSEAPSSGCSPSTAKPEGSADPTEPESSLASTKASNSAERLKIFRARPVAEGSTRASSRLLPGVVSNVNGHLLVGTATEPLELLEVQAAGKKPMNALDWWRGVRDAEKVVLR